MYTDDKKLPSLLGIESWGSEINPSALQEKLRHLGHAEFMNRIEGRPNLPKFICHTTSKIWDHVMLVIGGQYSYFQYLHPLTSLCLFNTETLTWSRVIASGNKGNFPRALVSLNTLS
jgi:hypothetical protein